MKWIISLLFVLLVVSQMYAQQESEWVRYYNDIATIDDIEAENWEDIYDMLCEMEEHPINLNRATPEDLEQMPFLTYSQIEDICEYLYMYGSMKTFSELEMIKSLDASRRKLLQCFTYLGSDERDNTRFPSAKNITRYGRHELMATAKLPFYERKGQTNGKYIGDKYKHSLRYTFNYGDFIKIGFTGSKDAGEPFFKDKNNLGYDSYSAYIQFKHLGPIDIAVLGDYKLSFGMGLVVNSDFNLGKMAMITNLGRTSNVIRGNTSPYGENRYRGAAFMFRIAHPLTLSTFVSYKGVDATMNMDSLSVSTIVTSGYHRTETEMAKKNNTFMTDAGVNVNYRANGLHFGATALYTHINPRLSPNTSSIYRFYYPSGSDFFNASINYGYTHHLFTVNGETAVNGDGRIATINSISANISDNLTALVLQRFYSYKYTSMHANSFSSGGRVQNESGVYAGIDWNCLPHLSLMAYSDYAYYAWPRYYTSITSHAWDNMLQATYSRKCWSLAARYRINMKERDNKDKTFLTDYIEHRARLAVTIEPSEVLQTKTQIDYARVNYMQTDCGYAATQMIMLAPCMDANKLPWLKLYASLTYFDSDSYNSRLYVYERGLQYSYYIPSFYGKGMRYTFMVKANLRKHFTMSAKIGVTDYFNRTTIGSGYQTINASSQTELDLQIKYRF